MIYGIGIDIIKIGRLKEIAEKWDKQFLERVFTDDEISYCYKKRDPYLSLAVRFAAKEAMIKAIGSEVAASMSDIEVITSDNGKPVIRVSGKLEKLFQKKKIKQALLSLSHEKDYGVACVVLEK